MVCDYCTSKPQNVALNLGNTSAQACLSIISLFRLSQIIITAIVSSRLQQAYLNTNVPQHLNTEKCKLNMIQASSLDALV